MNTAKPRNRALSSLLSVVRLSSLPKTELEGLRWMVQLRVRIGLLVLVTIIVSHLIEPSPWELLLALTGIDLAYLGLGAMYSYLLSGERAGRFMRLVLQVQLPEKLVLSTLAVYFTGGVLTAGVLVYPLAIIEAIVLLNPRGVYRVGAASIACFCSLALLESLRLIPYFSSYPGTLEIHEIATATTYAMHTVFVSSMLIFTTYMGSLAAQLIRYRNTLIGSQLKDLRTLYDIASGLGNSGSEEALLRYLATTLKESQGASMCIIGLLNNDGQVEIKASAGVPPDKLSKLVGITSTSPGLEELFSRGEPLVMQDLHLRPDRNWVLSADTRSAYVYPIKLEGKVLGGISLSFREARPFSPEYHELMTTVVSQAGVAIERARALHEAQRMAREMSALYDVGLQTGSTLSKAEILKRTSDHIERLMSPDMYYIALYDEATGIITFETMIESGQPMPKMVMSAQGSSLTAKIIKDKASLLVEDWLAEGQEYNDIAQKSGADMLSYLGAPMMLDDRVVGVMSVQCTRPNAFDAQDEKFLTAMGAQTAMALENARLHQEVQEQARYDSLTQVYNHGYFLERVRQAIELSDQNDGHVALIMLDIDHFKKYNDNYGHVAGDNVLRMVAQALKGHTREGDYVGRWGGEEFGVLLGSAGVAEAKKIARRIRRAVSELYPIDGHGQLIPNPTISQGISVYPFPSATASELIEHADAALYHAKEAGRNQLMVFETTGWMRESTDTTDELSRPKLSQAKGPRTKPFSSKDRARIAAANLDKSESRITRRLS